MVQFNILAAIIMVSASIPTFAAPVLGDEWNLQARSPSPTGGVVGPTGRPKPAGPRPQGSSAKRVRSRDLEESELDARDPKIHIHFGSFLKKVAGVLIREEGGGEVFSRAVDFDGLD